MGKLTWVSGWLLGTIVLLSLTGVAQGNGIATWGKEYGNNNSIASIHPASDGGYIAVGDTMDTGQLDKVDVWLVKLRKDGAVEWSRSYRGKYDLYGINVSAASDGGYYVLGDEYSPKDFEEIAVIRVDAAGQIEWQRIWGTMGNDWPSSVASTADGGCIVAGETRAYPAVENTPQAWLLKLDRDGEIEWAREYPYTASLIHRVLQTDDGGYIACGDIAQSSTYSWDAWIVKLDPNGNIEWEEAFDRSGDDAARDVHATPTGGYLLVGWTTFYREGNTDKDAVVLRLDRDGKVQWIRGYGVPKRDDKLYAIAPAPEGKWVIAGTTGKSAWLSKLDSSGEMLWQREYTFPHLAVSFTSFCPAADGGYVVFADRCKDSRCQNYVFALDQEAAIAKCRYCRTEPAHFVASPHFLYLPYRTYIKPKDIRFYLRDEEIVLSPPDEIQVKTLCRGSRG